MSFSLMLGNEEHPEVEDPEILRDVVNRNFQEAGLSPIALHGATKSRQLIAARNKLARMRIFQKNKLQKNSILKWKA